VGHAHDVIDELRVPPGRFSKGPRGVGGIHQNCMAEGVLPARAKELMALPVAVVKACDGCIAYNAKYQA